MKITYLGDSITVGQHSDPAKRWTNLIDARLREHFTDVQSRNLGINGETTRLALERFPQAVQAAPPDILTIQYGLNDCNCWQSDKGAPRVSDMAFQSNLEEMVNRAFLFGVKHVILLTNHPTTRQNIMLNHKSYEKNNRYYSILIIGAAENTDATLCDTRSAFKGKNISECVLTDGLHPTELGYQIYADAIWSVIKPCAEECK